MNNEEIREELIRILKGAYKNDYMWYYDEDEFNVFKSLIDLINKLRTKDQKKLPYDEWDIVHDEY